MVEGDRQNYLNAAAMMRTIEGSTLRQIDSLIREDKKDEAKKLLDSLLELNPDDNDLRQKGEELFTN